MGSPRLGLSGGLTEPSATALTTRMRPTVFSTPPRRDLVASSKPWLDSASIPHWLAELAQIEGVDDYCPLGEVPIEWVEKRILGLAATDKDYADVCSSEWVSRLLKSLAIHLKKWGVEEFDASVLQRTAPRILTQSVSRIVFDGGFAGIYHHSKYGHDIENWALFEPFQIMVQEPEFIRPDDPDLQRALARQSLKFKQ